MSELVILDAGRADAMVLLYDRDADSKGVAVMDGGVKERNGRQDLADFLAESGVKAIDLLILTHLHQDHFGGFYNLIHCWPVKRAVLPWRGDEFHPSVYPYYASAEYFREYEAFCRYLEEQGTEIHLSADMAGTALELGDCLLRCLYPAEAGPSEISRCLDRLCRPDLTPPELRRYCDRFRELCNADSSIWALERDGVCMALLTGDSTAAICRKAFQRYGKSPQMLKLSHHGTEEKYFNPSLIQDMDPQVVVVTNEREGYETIREACEAAAGSAELYYTFQGHFRMTI